MNKFNSIFGQILQIFSRSEFYKAVMETGAEKRAKGFTCWEQFENGEHLNELYAFTPQEIATIKGN